MRIILSVSGRDRVNINRLLNAHDVTDSNHPKSAVFFDFQEVPTFVLKKVMFNLNESNRFVMSRNPVDLRKGVDSLCGAIRSCHQPYRIETPPLGTRRVYLVL